jgi:hypothetical protein
MVVMSTRDHTLTAEDRAVRGYSWPPFRDGNRAALKHGAFSEQLATETTREIAPHLFELTPWLDRPEYVHGIARYLRAEALSLLAFRAIERIATAEGAENVPRKLWEAHNAAANTAMRQASLLGLDPTSHARLAATPEARSQAMKANVAKLVAQGEALRMRQEQDSGMASNT